MSIRFFAFPLSLPHSLSFKCDKVLSDYFAVRCYFAASVLLLLLFGRRHYASSSQHPVPNKISFNIHVIDLQRERVERERSKKNLLSCSSFSPISHSVPRQLSVLFYHPWVFHGEVSNCTSHSSFIFQQSLAIRIKWMQTPKNILKDLPTVDPNPSK